MVVHAPILYVIQCCIMYSMGARTTIYYAIDRHRSQYTPHKMDEPLYIYVYRYSVGIALCVKMVAYVPCFQGQRLLSFSCLPVYRKGPWPASSLPEGEVEEDSMT